MARKSKYLVGVLVATAGYALNYELRISNVEEIDRKLYLQRVAWISLDANITAIDYKLVSKKGRDGEDLQSLKAKNLVELNEVSSELSRLEAIREEERRKATWVF